MRLLPLLCLLAACAEAPTDGAAKDAGSGDTDDTGAAEPSLAGCTLTQLFDQGGDGTIESTTVTAYDDAERVSTSSQATGGGTDDKAYTYDANDCVVASTSEVVTQQGSVSASMTATCDAQGWSTHEDVHREVRGSDSEEVTDNPFDFTNTYDGELIRLRERDAGADGTVDVTVAFTWNADGQKTREETDVDADGTADSFRAWTYDAAGDLATAEEWTPDTPHRLQTFTRDADGREVRVEDDTESDGTPDRVTTLVYDGATFFDAHISVDEGADETVDSTGEKTAVCP